MAHFFYYNWKFESFVDSPIVNYSSVT